MRPNERASVPSTYTSYVAFVISPGMNPSASASVTRCFQSASQTSASASVKSASVKSFSPPATARRREYTTLLVLVPFKDVLTTRYDVFSPEPAAARNANGPPLSDISSSTSE